MAPATISAGAWSPPMASTAMGSKRLLDVDGLAAAVPTAVGADHVRQFGLPALRARAAGGGGEPPVGGAAASALRLRCLLLGDGHGCRSLVLQGVERRPSRIGWGGAVPAVALVAVGSA